MKNKLYFIFMFILGLAYFLDVFIGMFMIQKDYIQLSEGGSENQ